MGNPPTLTVEKVVTKTVEKIVEKTVEVPKFPELMETSFEDLEKIRSLSNHLSLLHELSSVDQMDLMTLSEKTGLNPQRIVEFIEDQEKIMSDSLYILHEIPLDLRGRILQTIGLSPRKNYNVSLSPMGVDLLSILSP